MKEGMKMLEVIKISDGMGLDNNLFFFKTENSAGDEVGELCFIAGEEEVGQLAGDIYNWDDGEPESYTLNISLEELFDLLKSKSSEDESSEWIEEYI